MKKKTFLFSIFMFLVVCSACSSKTKERERKAIELGQSDAIEFVELANNEKTPVLKLQDYLLLVRHKEHTMKDAGFDKASEKYIESFKKTLLEKDSTVYLLVFPEK